MKLFRRLFCVAAGLMLCATAALLTAWPASAAADADGAQMAASAPTTQWLADSLAKPGAKPDQADATLTNAADKGISVNYPAGWRTDVVPGDKGVMMLLHIPDKAGVMMAGWFEIIYEDHDPAGAKTLDDKFKASTKPEGLPTGATVYGPIRCKLAGADALAYLVDSTIDTMHSRDVHVIAFVNGKDLSVSLESPSASEMYGSNWDAFRRTMDSIKLTK